CGPPRALRGCAVRSCTAARGTLACDRSATMLARRMTRTTPGPRFAIALALPLVSILAACGGAPPPATPSTVAIAKPAAPIAPPPDLAAVPEPEGLVVFARLAKPSEALAVIGGWVHMPMPGAEQVGALVAGEPTGNAIDLDQPIDYAITLK